MTKKAVFNVSDDLSDLEQKIAEKQKEQEAEQAETEEGPQAQELNFYDAIYSILEPKGVSRADVDELKRKFPNLYVFPWSDDDIFIFRPLKRNEWKLIRQASENQEELALNILKKGCVWPLLDEETVSTQLAGTVDTMVELISRVSMFIPVEEAISLVKQL